MNVGVHTQSLALSLCFFVPSHLQPLFRLAHKLDRGDGERVSTRSLNRRADTPGKILPSSPLSFSFLFSSSLPLFLSSLSSSSPLFPLCPTLYLSTTLFLFFIRQISTSHCIPYLLFLQSHPLPSLRLPSSPPVYCPLRLHIQRCGLLPRLADSASCYVGWAI